MAKSSVGRLLVVAALCGMPAAALPPEYQPQPGASPSAHEENQGRDEAPRTAGRRELALAYMRFDRAFMEHRPQDAAIADINQRFDKATLLFFSGNLSAVVEAVDALTAELLGIARGELAAIEPQRPVDAGSVERARAIAKRLDAIEESNEKLATARGIARARAMILAEEDVAGGSARFLSNPGELIEQVDNEVGALERGKNPYARKAGKLWRPIMVEGSAIPCWVYAPEAVKEARSMPLVIALHGAGGDEAMFVEAYGAGLITTLADERGFIVASPSSYPFVTSAAILDRLIEQMSADYAVDRERIYVLGHSMGGMAASVLASSRRETLAAAAGICGSSGFNKAAPPCPMLVVGGEIDPIVSAGSLKTRAERAQRAGLDVEYRELASYGHTLAVNAALPEVIEWLLEHRRAVGSQ
ncbi:MAG TPA: dienelactone hydrolase family protein [Phycisphaerales bacterium]|nr:dienelactone hydrolase family protein [Phycisphaerales bacterium]